MKVSLLQLFIGICILLCIAACANRISPSGGPKDIEQPSVLASTPANKQTRFDAETITLQFNEFVDLKDPKNQILISPYMKEFPEFKKKGKSIQIKFKEPLRPNTTYTLNFGEAIVDITEGNPLSNFEYSFSTGEVLDSLSVKGKVLLSKNNAPVEKAIVGLYPEGPDSLFTTTSPIYIARTDANGRFQINNIAAGNYQLVSLEDINNNYFYDQPNEKVAFLDSLIAVDTSQQVSYKLRMFSEGNETVKLMAKEHREYGRLNMVFSREMDSIDVSLVDNPFEEEDLQFSLSEKNDTLDVWFRNAEVEEVEGVKVIVRSEPLAYLDTIPFKKLLDKKTSKALKYITNMRTGREQSFIHIQKPLELEFNHPIQSFDPTKVTLLVDSIPVKTPTDQLVKQDPYNARKIRLYHKWEQEVSYLLQIPDSSIIDFFGKKNEAINISFKTTPRDRYGNLKISLQEYDEQKQYVLLIYSGKAKLVRQEVVQDSTINLNYMETGKYNIYIVDDTNKNGDWDPGNYEKKLQAEQVYNSSTPTQIKANWDTEIELELIEK